MEEKYNKLIGKRYFGWEIIETNFKNEELLCLRIEENNFEEFKIGEKRIFPIQHFILKYLNEQSSKHKTIPEELFELLK